MTPSVKRASEGTLAPAGSTLYLYSGAGNTFVVIDGRGSTMRASTGEAAFSGETVETTFCGETVDVVGLCAKYGTDGLMILREGTFYDEVAGDKGSGAAADGPAYDFAMEFYNPDGSGGMMCGNGGRCIVAFADYLGIKPSNGRSYIFEAPDGLHEGEILNVADDNAVIPDPIGGLVPDHHRRAADGVVKTVRIKMIDVREFHPALDGWFVDTGTRHFVKFVPEVEGLDMDTEGKRYRWDPAFAPIGANANFVKIEPCRLKVRTFEKGVEGETLACGTGITASAIAAWLAGTHAPSDTSAPASSSSPAGSSSLVGISLPAGTTSPAGFSSSLRETISYNVRAREDDLRVEFRPVFCQAPGDTPAATRRVDHFEDVYLTGPAKLYRIIE